MNQEKIPVAYQVPIYDRNNFLAPLHTPEAQHIITAGKLNVFSNGYTPIHPFNDLKIIHGAGTAALELLEDTDNLDAILMPVGGGGLTSGTALIAKSTSPSITMIAVEPEIANDAYWSFYNGKKLYPPFNTHTIADGLRTGLGDITFEIIKNTVDHIILVSE